MSAASRTDAVRRRSLLAPARRLMDRLTYPRKFLPPSGKPSARCVP
jgi:hypothetical protein